MRAVIFALSIFAIGAASAGADPLPSDAQANLSRARAGQVEDTRELRIQPAPTPRPGDPDEGGEIAGDPDQGGEITQLNEGADAGGERTTTLGQGLRAQRADAPRNDPQ